MSHLSTVAPYSEHFSYKTLRRSCVIDVSDICSSWACAVYRMFCAGRRSLEKFRASYCCVRINAPSSYILWPADVHSFGTIISWQMVSSTCSLLTDFSRPSPDTIYSGFSFNSQIIFISFTWAFYCAHWHSVRMQRSFPGTFSSFRYFHRPCRCSHYYISSQKIISICVYFTVYRWFIHTPVSVVYNQWFESGASKSMLTYYREASLLILIVYYRALSLFWISFPMRDCWRSLFIHAPRCGRSLTIMSNEKLSHTTQDFFRIASLKQP